MKMQTNPFKQAITAGKPQLGVWSSLCSNIAADILSTAAFDWVLIDMEHSPNELPSVLSQLQAYRAGTVHPIVRPPWNEPVMVKRLLDLGAPSLLFPMVQNADEAEAAVRACRYPPNGIRGVSLSQRANAYGSVTDYIDRCEDEICVLVQIETRAALDRVEEIAGVDGVDGVFFGPADLSADMGLLGQPNHDDVAAAIKGGADRVRAVGKATGILVGDAALATMWLGAGITFVACGSDLNLLARGARSLADTVRQESGLKG